MYPDVENVLIDGKPGSEIINDMNWVTESFLPTVQQRGKAVIDSRGASSATSAAKDNNDPEQTPTPSRAILTPSGWLGCA